MSKVRDVITRRVPVWVLVLTVYLSAAVALAQIAPSPIHPSSGGGAASFPLLGPDGNVTAPSFSFESEPGLGMYRTSGGVIGFTDGAGLNTLNVGVNLVRMQAATALGWSSTGDATGAADTSLVRLGVGHIGIVQASSGITNNNSTAGTGFLGTRFQVIAGNPTSIVDGSSLGQFIVWSHRNDTQSGTALTEGAADSVVRLPVASGARVSMLVEWSVEATDATDHQVRTGITYVAAVNKAGTETCVEGDVGTPIVAVSAGTLTVTTSCDTTPTNAVDLQLNATSSLTQTQLTATWTVIKSRQGQVSLQ